MKSKQQQKCIHAVAIVMQFSIFCVGIAVDENYVYWINKDAGILYRTQKNNVQDTERVNVNMQSVSDLKLIRKTYQLKSKCSILWWIDSVVECFDYQALLCLCIMLVWKIFAHTCVYQTGTSLDILVLVLQGFKTIRTVHLVS